MKDKEVSEKELTCEETATATEEAVTEEATVEETVSKSELDAANKEIAELKDKYLRTAAEYDNFRKRTAREREALFGDATAATVSVFLTVYDNLERAMENPTTDEAYKKGVELTFAQLCDVLKKINVSIISPLGETFDPNFHNAVMHEENAELSENTISEVFQKGFKLGERVIRPALVKVAN